MIIIILHQIINLICFLKFIIGVNKILFVALNKNLYLHF